MNVSKIMQNQPLPYSPPEVKRSEIENVKKATQQDTLSVSGANSAWQKDILLSALDNIEKKMGTASGHPLDGSGNQPIETYEEAMIELSFVKGPRFRQEAGGAQANIEPRDVLYLFTEEN